MKIYLVGGAIRDLLLKRPVKERDFLVVNGTIEEMVDQGFIQVGKDFPVFLHPVTKEEYALARVERKVGIGYYGFTCDSSNAVTLEEDLIRRDLTINAMVLPVTNTSHIDLENIKSEDIIDPFGGKADIENRVLRHVSDAFAEDPVRVLRISRFMARYHHLGFTVAPETIQLLKTIVANGEINNLVAERVWKELERTLSEKDPHLFFITLTDCDAFKVLFPSFNSQNYSIGIQSLIKANQYKETIKLAAFLHTLPTKDIEKLSQRFRFPNHYKDLCLLVAKYHDLAIKISVDISNDNSSKLAHELLELFVGLNVIHQIDRFENFLNTVSAIFKRNNDEECFPIQKLLTIASTFKEESAKITQRLLVDGIHGKEMGASLQKERLSCIKLLLSQPP